MGDITACLWAAGLATRALPCAAIQEVVVWLAEDRQLCERRLLAAFRQKTAVSEANVGCLRANTQGMTGPLHKRSGDFAAWVWPALACLPGMLWLDCVGLMPLLLPLTVTAARLSQLQLVYSLLHLNAVNNRYQMFFGRKAKSQCARSINSV